MKPRITRTRVPGMFGWMCHGSDLAGYGETPLGAYQQWRGRMWLRISSSQPTYTYARP